MKPVHTPATVAFWRRLVSPALHRAATPFYLFSIEPVRQALAELSVLEHTVPVPVRHWLSCKTQPVAPLLSWWKRQGFGIEVVSEFEYLAARNAGFEAGRILVNGPAKHAWLARHRERGLHVNFDSPAELRSLAPLARAMDWSVGIRCRTRGEVDPLNPGLPTQFGFSPSEAVAAMRELRSSGARLETVHFHLRTNVPSPDWYGRAFREVAGICREAGFSPAYLDCGGGLPPHHTLSLQGRRYDRQFDLRAFARVCADATRAFPGARELWLENGRFVMARSGVLVVRILDVKGNGRHRHLICDGGRTLHALISQWEGHEMISVPRRSGPCQPTLVCGPTCMAFDQFTRRPLPRRLRPGDCLVWMDAGAYHLPWETRFSHGHAAVLWHEEGRLKLARRAQDFGSWWAQWEPLEASEKDTRES